MRNAGVGDYRHREKVLRDRQGKPTYASINRRAYEVAM